jgi:hypothetical protein
MPTGTRAWKAHDHYDAGDHVTRYRHKADDGIQAQPDIGAVQDKGAVHQARQSFQTRHRCVSVAE